MVKLSIITTVLNAADTIRTCIESARSQSQSIEHIIIDGGSTDGTLEIIDEFRPHLTKIVSEPDKGIYEGMNKGLRLATGDIVGLLNADDVYASSVILSRVLRVYER